MDEKLAAELFRDIKELIRAQGETNAALAHVASQQETIGKMVDEIKGSVRQHQENCPARQRIEGHIRDHEKQEEKIPVVEAKKDRRTFGWVGIVISIGALAISIITKLIV